MPRFRGDPAVAKGQEQSSLMAGSWLPTFGGRGRSRIWEREGDKSKWWGWEEGKERATGRKLPGDGRGWLKRQGIFRVGFRRC